MRLVSLKKVSSALKSSAGRLLILSTCCSTSANTARATSSVESLMLEQSSLQTGPRNSFFTSTRMLSHVSLTTFERFPTTSSMVPIVKFKLRRIMTTSTEPSTRVPVTCMLVNGGKHNSASCGYCETQPRSAPLSIMPICISRIVPMPAPLAYWNATLRSVVVDMKAYSTPPRTPVSFAFQNCRGNRPPEMPRQTVSAFVILLVLTMPDVRTKFVVQYLFGHLLSPFPPQSSLKRVFMKSGVFSSSNAPPRLTMLYFSKSGPV
mmetsp:Transcript_172365/g.552491  ORF Transcript_172365/g.552491 Transcript_172365/m.552491 type:complete len:263 (+) Transcript_172365:1685-2473(+)